MFGKIVVTTKKFLLGVILVVGSINSIVFAQKARDPFSWALKSSPEFYRKVACLVANSQREHGFEDCETCHLHLPSEINENVKAGKGRIVGHNDDTNPSHPCHSVILTSSKFAYCEPGTKSPSDLLYTSDKTLNVAFGENINDLKVEDCELYESSTVSCTFDSSEYNVTYSLCEDE